MASNQSPQTNKVWEPCLDVFPCVYNFKKLFISEVSNWENPTEPGFFHILSAFRLRDESGLRCLRNDAWHDGHETRNARHGRQPDDDANDDDEHDEHAPRTEKAWKD